MKKTVLFILSMALVFSMTDLRAGEQAVDAKTKEEVRGSLLQKYGESQKFRIEKGVEQAASLWRNEDGSPEDFKNFCQQNFIAEPELLNLNFQRLETLSPSCGWKMLLAPRSRQHLFCGPLMRHWNI